jgi:hypothetical protein
LRALERSLKAFVEACSTQCAGGPAGACVILEDLATPQVQCGSAGGKAEDARAVDCCSNKS